MRNSVSRLRFYGVTLSFLGIMSGAALAELGDPVAKLLPNDGGAQKRFGKSVAISGGLVIVGSPLDDDNGVQTGSATLFDSATGAQILQLVPDDGAALDEFGTSVGISGTIAVVGAPKADPNGEDSGAAYLFDVTTGLQIAKLVASDGAEVHTFGTAVAIDGKKVVVGAPGHSDFEGAAYIFDAVSGFQTAKLVGSDVVSLDFVGVSVAIRGNTVIVGGGGFVLGAGSAYLFDATTGLETAKLLPPDGLKGDHFGEVVAVSETMALVGAKDGIFGSGPFKAGAAYLFDIATGSLLMKLVPTTDPLNSSRFGSAVAINGTMAVVGAHLAAGATPASGSAFIFDPTTGVQLAQVSASDGASGHQFGLGAAAVDGPTIVIGAPSDSENGSNSGSAYVFEGKSLAGDVEDLSLSAGGQLAMTYEAGSSRAGWFHYMLGSASGTTPGIDFGGVAVLPLNFDGYFNMTLGSPRLAPFGKFVGMLNGAGQATSTLTIPALLDPSLAGVVLNHAYIAASLFQVPEFASNPVQVTLVP